MTNENRCTADVRLSELLCRILQVGDELADLVEPQSGLARQWREAKQDLGRGAAGMTTRYQQACERGTAMIGIVVELAFELERIAQKHPCAVDAKFMKRIKGLSDSEAKLRRVLEKDDKELRKAYIDGGLGAKKYVDFMRQQFEYACGLRHNA